MPWRIAVLLLMLTHGPAWAAVCGTVAHVGDATVDTTAGGSVVMQRNTLRCAALIQNAGTVPVRCRGDGGDPASNRGTQIPASTALKLDAGEATNEWKCIAESTSSTVTVTEVLP